MTSEQWAQIKAITADALDLTPADGHAFAIEACKQYSEEVRDEVIRLLAHARASEHSILSKPPWAGNSSVEAAEPPDEPIVVPDRFQIIRELGRGGMGIVFEAIDRERNMVVALKTLPVVSPTRWLAFRQEFRALASLSHPNLVCLYDFIRHDNRCFLSMELIRGTHFPASAPAERLRILALQAVSGIASIHAAGHLHGDLKPANVLVTDADRVVIVDFGLAAEIQALDGHTVAGGTPRYMAPEILDGRASQSSDWYALGRMLADALEVSAAPPYLTQLCQNLLDPVPAQRPAHHEILKILGGEEYGGVFVAPARVELVGRGGELASLRHAYTKSRSSPGTVPVLVSAPSGYGKTLLIQRFLEGVREDAPVLLQSRCYRQESGPYKALDDIIGEFCRLVATLPADQAGKILPDGVAPIAILFPALHSVSQPTEPESLSDPMDLRRRAFRFVRNMFMEASRQFSIVLWLDDLQWMDQESVDVLAEMLDDPSPRVLLVCSFRRSEVGKEPSPLEKFLRLPVFETNQTLDIRLEQLAPADAVSLALEIMPLCEPETAARIARESGGIPFFVLELARSARSSHAVSLDDLVGDRMARLTADTRKFLMAAAIAGRPIPQEFAFAAAGLELHDPAVLSQLTFAGLLRVDGSHSTDTIEPIHDRIRQAVCSLMIPAEVLAIHRSLAETMETSPRGDSETIAIHFEACGESERASRHYGSAGERASRALAFHRAARLLQKAIELHRSDGEERAVLETKAAEAFSNDGRSREASDYYRAAAGRLPPAKARYLDALSAYHLCIAGEIDEGRARFEDLLSGIPKRIYSGRRTALGAITIQTVLLHLEKPMAVKQTSVEDIANIDVVWLAAAGVGTSDLLGGFELMVYNVRQALRCGEPNRLIRILAFHAAFASMAGGARSSLALRHLALCEDLARQLGFPAQTRAVLTLTKAMRSYNLGFWREALEQYEAAEKILTGECKGLNWELAFARAGKMWSLVSCGAVQRLHSEALEIIADAQARGDLATAVNVGSLPLPYAMIVLKDQPSIARDTASAWLSRWTKAGYGLQHACGFLLTAWSLLYEDRISDAFELLEGEWKAVRKSGILGLPTSAALFWETRARILIASALRMSGLARRRRLYEAKRIADRLDRGEATHASAFAAQVRAALKAAEGDSDAAAALLERALEGFRKCGMALHELCVVRQLQLMQNPAAAPIHDSGVIANPEAVFRMHGAIQFGVQS